MSPHIIRWLSQIRDLTKQQRRRQRQRQKAIGLVSETTTLHVHQAFLYISLPSLRDYNSFFQHGNGNAINSTISVWTRVRPPFFSCNLNSLLLSNWATWNNREMVWKDAESIFQRRFHGRRRCRIVLKVSISGHVQPCVKQKCLRSFTSNKTKNKMNYEKLLGWQVFKSRSQSVSIFLKFVHPRHLPGEGGGGTWVNFSLGMCHW